MHTRSKAQCMAWSGSSTCGRTTPQVARRLDESVRARTMRRVSPYRPAIRSRASSQRGSSTCDAWAAMRRTRSRLPSSAAASTAAPASHTATMGEMAVGVDSGAAIMAVDDCATAVVPAAAAGRSTFARAGSVTVHSGSAAPRGMTSTEASSAAASTRCRRAAERVAKAALSSRPAARITDDRSARPASRLIASRSSRCGPAPRCARS